MKVFGDSTGQTFITAGALAGVTVLVAAHASELVVVEVRSHRARLVSCDATQ